MRLSFVIIIVVFSVLIGLSVVGVGTPLMPLEAVAGFRRLKHPPPSPDSPRPFVLPSLTSFSYNSARVCEVHLEILFLYF
jgi:hypothetical protein